MSGTPKVLSSERVAELTGWSLGYVRKGMARYGIELVHGWPEDQVMALLPQIQEARERNPGRGRRTGDTQSEAP